MITKQTKADICNAYHAARVIVGNGRFERMQYVKRQMIKTNPSLSPKRTWLDIEEALA